MESDLLSPYEIMISMIAKTERQQAYVKESLTRAIQEVKLARLEGRKLPDARDIFKEIDVEG